jgi:hypothetical protein
MLAAIQVKGRTVPPGVTCSSWLDSTTVNPSSRSGQGAGEGNPLGDVLTSAATDRQMGFRPAAVSKPTTGSTLSSADHPIPSAPEWPAIQATSSSWGATNRIRGCDGTGDYAWLMKGSSGYVAPRTVAASPCNQSRINV